MSDQLKPIAHLRSPFKEKFGIPRQSGLINSASAYIDFVKPYDDPDAFRGLEQFSHIWLIFQFHANRDDHWRPLVRPPRLGGNRSVGVFASRSPYRPNQMGMSVAELIDIHVLDNSAYLEIRCPDILDGTPLVDIKPYIAYSDSIADAESGFASASPTVYRVLFSEKSRQQIDALDDGAYGELSQFIKESLQYDPRPSYHKHQPDRIYGIRLYDLNIRWGMTEIDEIEVFSVEKLASK